MSYLKNIPKDRKIYGNYKVLSPEGILMFRCNEKKINWYLNRNLADIVENEIQTIKLKFKPNGLGNHEREYGLFELENRCVCCGSFNYLTRHHVVPSCYRKYFPIEIKSHNFHDVVSLCTTCHGKYEECAFSLKKELAEIFDSPINGIMSEDSPMIKAKRLAHSLSDTTNIPTKRIHEIKSQIKSILGIKRLSRSRISNLINSRFRKCEKTHGEIVVSRIGSINEFIKMWRNHFLSTMDCKFLPKNWSVNNE